MEFKDLSEKDQKTIRDCMVKLGKDPDGEIKGFFCTRKDIKYSEPNLKKELTERQKLIKRLKELT